ncbi:hypothetical protein U6A24_05940 [Aquimarina gracilis]|uniref:Lipoprotein n=1 Tax=Aquimarina gracilis TaxID=874422 RepID=A0ABU5ZSD8_9FLAO|nr:hypothetical protein [Aquimarina gracilis]MEB3344990.1 hypothetical protein [Aquimarina gracilis]
MKRNKQFFVATLLICALSIQSCGPVVISSSLDNPPPPWFYPNRVEVVRYVYFPDYNIYYDLTLRHYIYFENNVWVTVDVLPPRYRYINLNRTRYVRIRGFRGDDINRYHSTNRYYNPNRSTRSRYEDRSRYNRNNTTRSRRSRSSNTSNREKGTRSTRNKNTTGNRTTRSRDSIQYLINNLPR